MNKSFKIINCAGFQLLRDGEIFYTMENKITNGLIRNGHFVYNFSYRDIAKESNIFKNKRFGIKTMNKRFFDTIKNIKPDILLLGHTELITLDTLEKIKELLPNTKIIMWWIDWLGPEKKIKHIKEREHLIDVFITNVYPDIAKSKLNNPKYPIYYLPNMCDSSIETLKNFENSNLIYDLIYIGRLYNDTKKSFIENITHLQNINFKHYGKNNPVFGMKYFEELNSSKIGLNYSMFNDLPLGTSDRITHIMGNGICVMSPKVPKLDLLFNDNEIIYFDDFDDFKDKLFYFLKNDTERKRIAYNGWKKMHQNYNSTRITKYMIECLYDSFSEKYEWM